MNIEDHIFYQPHLLYCYTGRKSHWKIMRMYSYLGLTKVLVYYFVKNRNGKKLTENNQQLIHLKKWTSRNRKWRNTLPCDAIVNWTVITAVYTHSIEHLNVIEPLQKIRSLFCSTRAQLRNVKDTERYFS